MISADYTRLAGRNLTYRIDADEWGAYRIYLGDRELHSGRDALTAHGLRTAPNKRKAAGAFQLATQAIESLRYMKEF